MRKFRNKCVSTLRVYLSKHDGAVAEARDEDGIGISAASC
jgi:hypothetical protein